MSALYDILCTLFGTYLIVIKNNQALLLKLNIYLDSLFCKTKAVVTITAFVLLNEVIYHT